MERTNEVIRNVTFKLTRKFAEKIDHIATFTEAIGHLGEENNVFASAVQNYSYKGIRFRLKGGRLFLTVESGNTIPNEIGDVGDTERKQADYNEVCFVYDELDSFVYGLRLK